MSEDNIKDQSKKNIEYARLKGEYIGTIKGILLWEIPDELKEKLEKILQDLNKNPY